MDVNQSGTTPPRLSSAKPAALPKNVPQNPTDVNPEVTERMQEQAAQIPTTVPPPSALPPSQPLPHTVVPKQGEPKAAAVAKQLTSGEKSAKLMAFRNMATATRDLDVGPKKVLLPYEKCVEAHSRLLKLQEDLDKLTFQAKAPSGKEEKKPPEGAVPAGTVPLKAQIQVLEQQIQRLKQDIKDLAPLVMSDPTLYQQMLKDNPAMAIDVLKVWLPQHSTAEGKLPPAILTPLVTRFQTLMQEHRGNDAKALLNDLAKLEDAHSQQIIDELVKECCKTEGTIKMASAFICDLIRSDVSQAETEGTLLRSDTMRTKLYTAYQTERLRPLLQNTVGGVVTHVLKANIDYVTKNPDPRVGRVENLPAQIGNIKEICAHTDQFLILLQKELAKNPSPIPEDLSAIYRTLAESIRARNWNQNVDTHVNAFLFLRGICPAFSSPKRLGMQLQMSPQQTKNLLAVSIALLDVVNNPTELKGKWDQELFIPTQGQNPSDTYVAKKQPILKEIGAILQKEKR